LPQQQYLSGVKFSQIVTVGNWIIPTGTKLALAVVVVVTCCQEAKVVYTR